MSPIEIAFYTTGSVAFIVVALVSLEIRRVLLPLIEETRTVLPALKSGLEQIANIFGASDDFSGKPMGTSEILRKIGISAKALLFKSSDAQNISEGGHRKWDG